LNDAAKLRIISETAKSFWLFVVFYFGFLWYFTLGFCDNSLGNFTRFFVSLEKVSKAIMQKRLLVNRRGSSAI